MTVIELTVIKKYYAAPARDKSPARVKGVNILEQLYL